MKGLNWLQNGLISNYTAMGKNSSSENIPSGNFATVFQLCWHYVYFYLCRWPVRPVTAPAPCSPPPQATGRTPSAADPHPRPGCCCGLLLLKAPFAGPLSMGVLGPLFGGLAPRTAPGAPQIAAPLATTCSHRPDTRGDQAAAPPPVARGQRTRWNVSGHRHFSRNADQVLSSQCHQRACPP